MENNFPFDEGEITAQDLANIHNPSTDFMRWLGEKWISGELHLIIKGLIRAGVVSGLSEALSYLNSQSSEVRADELTIAGCDFKGRHTRPINKLKVALGSEARPGDLYSGYGILGHRLIRKFASGEIFSFEEKSKSSQGDFQLDLFGYKDITGEQLEMFCPNKPNFPAIRSAWKRVNKILEKNQWADWYKKWWLEQKNIREIDELYKNLSFLFENKSNLLSNTYLATISMLSWVSSIVYFRENGFYREVIFPEIQVLPNTTFGLNGGHMDGIEVFSIEGKSLKNKQNFILRRILENHLSKRYQIQNIGHLARIISVYFHCPLESIEFLIYDWKFAVGDGKGKILKISDLPVADHASQMKKYLALSSIGINFIRDGRVRRQQSWERLLNGKLVYIFHDKVVVKDIETSSVDKEQIFLEEIVLQHKTAKERAMIRRLNNGLIGHILKLLLENNSNGKRKNSNGKNKNLSLFQNRSECGIEVLVQKYRHLCFLDPDQIIEKVRSDKGKIEFILHVEKLERIIMEKKLQVQKKSNGWIVPCMTDNKHSMHINLLQGVFKCFGECGIFGHLISSSSGIELLPADAKVEILSERNQKAKVSSKFKKITIPERHTQIMNVAQESLQLMFGGSDAERYLREERKIDLDLAFEMGAGFGNDILIHNLLDFGLDYEEIIRYGFIGFSPKLDLNSGLSPLFRKRGMKAEEITRPVELERIAREKREKIVKTGYPFLKFYRRITFPLEWAGRITNFYARAIDLVGSAYKHRKLAITDEVPQGAFNIQVLEYPDSNEVFVTEAVLESLSLISLGLATKSNTLALVGKGNHLVIEAMAYSGKTIAMSLNWDEPKWNKANRLVAAGQDATAKIIKYFKEVGRKDFVWDFSAEFAIAHRELGYGDYNEWWKKIIKT